MDEATAKSSPLALWTATVSSGKVKLTNQAGQSLTYYGSGNTRYFYATTDSSNNQNLTASENNGVFRLSYKSGAKTYYLCALNSSSYAATSTSTNSALQFSLILKTVTSMTYDLDGYGYSITNTPLDEETSVKVTKHWNQPLGDASLYEKAQVTIRLYANGVDTGRTETVNLKNNWTVTFHGLPYRDEAGVPITYTVVETWETLDWIPVYGQVASSGGTIPTYAVTVTNVYRWTGTVALPATGGEGTLCFVLIGLILVIGPFVYGFSLRRRYERRSKQ